MSHIGKMKSSPRQFMAIFDLTIRYYGLEQPALERGRISCSKSLYDDQIICPQMEPFDGSLIKPKGLLV
jgi:hypothetical protein